MTAPRLLRITMPFACFGLDVRGDKIIRPSAPLARWCVGRSASWAIRYWQRRGATVEWVDLATGEATPATAP